MSLLLYWMNKRFIVTGWFFPVLVYWALSFLHCFSWIMELPFDAEKHLPVVKSFIMFVSNYQQTHQRGNMDPQEQQRESRQGKLPTESCQGQVVTNYWILMSETWSQSWWRPQIVGRNRCLKFWCVLLPKVRFWSFWNKWEKATKGEPASPCSRQNGNGSAGGSVECAAIEFADCSSFILTLRNCSHLVSLLRGSETWPVRNENEVALQWAEMRMVRWICGV